MTERGKLGSATKCHQLGDPRHLRFRQPHRGACRHAEIADREFIRGLAIVAFDDARREFELVADGASSGVKSEDHSPYLVANGDNFH